MSNKEKLKRMVKGEKVEQELFPIHPEDMTHDERDAMRKILCRLSDDGVDDFSDLSHLTDDELDTFQAIVENHQ